MIDFEAGDIVGLTTPNGRRYVQVTHQRAGLPEVLRIVEQTGDEADPEAIAARPTVSIVMMPLAYALERGRLEGEKIGQASVPEKYQPFPSFRNAVRGKRGEILYWWIWDGQGLSYVADPEDVDTDLPIREVTSPNRLVELISAA